MRVLITGGTGSLGQALTRELLSDSAYERICIYSRSEYTQAQMAEKFHDDRLRFFVGDVRDRERLILASTGIDVIIHTAALKRIDVVHYNPSEALYTNILGTYNVIQAAKDRVQRVVLISTDKAVEPVNFYGITKAAAEFLIIQSNIYTQKTDCLVVRYGNVLDSKGGVVEKWRTAPERAKITDIDMTRFAITMSQAVALVKSVIESDIERGSIVVPKLPTVAIPDLAEAVTGRDLYSLPEVGMRPGEKLHETLVSQYEMPRVLRAKDEFIIQPEFALWDKKQLEQLEESRGAIRKSYNSGENEQLTVPEIRRLLYGG